MGGGIIGRPLRIYEIRTPYGRFARNTDGSNAWAAVFRGAKRAAGWMQKRTRLLSAIENAQICIMHCRCKRRVMDRISSGTVRKCCRGLCFETAPKAVASVACHTWTCGLLADRRYHAELSNARRDDVRKQPNPAWTRYQKRVAKHVRESPKSAAEAGLFRAKR